MPKSTNLQTSYDAIVIGAGVAGLTFAWEYSNLGHTVLVLEKETQIGGLHRTIWHQKHGFDFSAHRFHSGNPYVLKRTRQLMGKQFRKRKKKSRIFLFGRYLNYPFDITELLLAMPPLTAANSIIGFLLARLKKNSQDPNQLKSYKDWSVHHFGLPLYQIMVKPYTSKLWHTDPAKISADWANQRFQTVKVRQIISQLLRRLLTLRFKPSKLEEDLYPDSGDFYYAKTGAQAIPDTLARAIKKNGSTILTNTTVSHIKPFNHHATVSFTHQGQEQRIKANRVITTAPLQTSVNLLTSKPPASISAALKRTKYLAIIFVNAVINKPRISRDTWLYFPTTDIIFNRAVEFKNWSTYLAPNRRQTGVCFDITCFPHDRLFSRSDSYIIDLVKSSAQAANLCEPEDFASAQVIRLKHAYPFYDLNYKPRLKRIVNFIEKSGKIFCLGRTGIARYNNADGSIEMGLELAKRIHHNSPHPSLLDYTFQAVSL